MEIKKKQSIGLPLEGRRIKMRTLLVFLFLATPVFANDIILLSQFCDDRGCDEYQVVEEVAEETVDEVVTPIDRGVSILIENSQAAYGLTKADKNMYQMSRDTGVLVSK